MIVHFIRKDEVILGKAATSVKKKPGIESTARDAWLVPEVLLESPDNPFHVILRHVEVGHKTNFVTAADENALISQIVLKGCEAVFFQRKENHVGLHLLRIDPEFLDFCKPLGKARGICMVLCKPIHMVRQGHDARCSEDACLAHAASEDLAPPPCLVDQFLRADKDGAYRSAKAL